MTEIDNPQVANPHRRIRPFNTKKTYPEQSLDNDLCQAVVARGTYVFMRGQVATDIASGDNVGIGDPTAQARKAMENVAMLLQEAGAEMAHVCKLTIYLTDVRHREPIYREVGRWFKGIHPCQTGLVVQALARPEWLVEIDVEAVIPE